MRKSLLAVGLVLGLPAMAAAQQIQLGVGATLTQVSELTDGYDASSGDVGYTLGGNLRFGKVLSLSPGLYWQQLRFDFKDEQAGTSEVLGLTGFQVPVLVGLGLDLKVVAARIYAGPSVTFLTSVTDNQFGLEKAAFKSTSFGGQIGVSVDVLMLAIDVSQEIPFTDVFESATPYGAGKLGVTRVGLAFRF